MIYKVTGVFRVDKAAEYRRLLSDGTIAAQKPDGAEIVASMGRAVVTPDGRVQWSELCYCDPALKHERATVLDRFFSSIETQEIPEYQSYQGLAFLDHLERLIAAS
jgi:hypothetical protein